MTASNAEENEYVDKWTAAGEVLKEYTAEEVAEHKEEDDLWMIIGNRVVDVSEFDDHPGGPDVLEGVGGVDATLEFEQIAHSNAAKKQVEDFVIGRLEGTEITDLAEDSGGDMSESSVLFTVFAVVVAIAAYYLLK